MEKKRIVVTGSSRGIGRETVRFLLDRGHEVLALTRNDAALEELSKTYSDLAVIAVDITTDEGLDGLVTFLSDRKLSLDGLVHNAGMLLNKPFEDTRVSDMMEVYKVNVFAVSELTRRLLPFFKKGAHVVGISSMGGIQGSSKFPGLAAYSSSKAALITLFELLAEEFKERGLSFNTLALGAVQTEMLEQAFPGYRASVTPGQMGAYVAEFVLTGHELFNGKVLQVSNSTP